MPAKLITNQMSMEEQKAILGPKIEEHALTYFTSLKKPIQPDAALIDSLKETTWQFLELKKIQAEGDDQRLVIAKFFLRKKAENEHGSLMKFFESFDEEVLGGWLPLREINRMTHPLKCVLQAAKSGKPLEQICAAGIVKPMPISELREDVDALNFLEGPEFKAELERHQDYNAFSKAWGGKTKQATPGARIVAGMKMVADAIAEIPGNFRTEINNQANQFFDAFDEVFSAAGWKKVGKLQRQLAKAAGQKPRDKKKIKQKRKDEPAPKPASKDQSAAPITPADDDQAPLFNLETLVEPLSAQPEPVTNSLTPTNP